MSPSGLLRWGFSGRRKIRDSVHLKLFLHNLGTPFHWASDLRTLDTLKAVFILLLLLLLSLFCFYMTATGCLHIIGQFPWLVVWQTKTSAHPSTQNVSFQMIPSTLEVNRRIHRHCSWLWVLILFHQWVMAPSKILCLLQRLLLERSFLLEASIIIILPQHLATHVLS